MTNRLRTLIARFIVRYLSGPRSLLVAALTATLLRLVALLWA
jgi:hypothetical protein